MSDKVIWDDSKANNILASLEHIDVNNDRLKKCINELKTYVNTDWMKNKDFRDNVVKAINVYCDCKIKEDNTLVVLKSDLDYMRINQ